jgi:hypothetical protein
LPVSSAFWNGCRNVGHRAARARRNQGKSGHAVPVAELSRTSAITPWRRPAFLPHRHSLASPQKLTSGPNEKLVAMGQLRTFRASVSHRARPIRPTPAPVSICQQKVVRPRCLVERARRSRSLVISAEFPHCIIEIRRAFAESAVKLGGDEARLALHESSVVLPAFCIVVSSFRFDWSCRCEFVRPSPTDYATQMLGTATFWNRCGEATTEDG